MRTLLVFPRVAAQTVLLALQQIWANKVRSILTTLGIVIGVASIIAVVAALAGLEKNILNEFDKFGTRRVYVGGHVPREWRSRISWREVQLTLEEIEAIDRYASAIDLITPMLFGGYPIQAADIKLDGAQVIGIRPEWHEVEGRAILIGRPFNAIDERERRDVCLVNEQAIADLALDRDPTGQVILISGQRFTIVGVVETIQFSQMFGGGETSAEIFIPLATAMRLRPEASLSHAWAQLSDPSAAPDATAEISAILRKMRGLEGDDPDTFRIEVIQQFIDGFQRVAGAITAGAGGVVGISLLVGGIGIMNIMLVSVSERTREIGLRKAVGARPAVILLQFLIEAITLSLIGGAIGLAIGQLMVLGMKQIPGAPLEEATIPLWVVLLSVGFSGAVGVVFGMFPAIKAARLDPIVALRHE